jgi:hypothetical protein
VTYRLSLLGALLLAGCATHGEPSLGREHTLVYVRTGSPGQFNIPATNAMPCHRLWSLKVASGWPPEDGTVRFGAGPATSVIGADQALVCSFDGAGPTPDAPKGIQPMFSVVLFPTGEIQAISASGLVAPTKPTIPRLPPEVLKLCPFPRQYISAIHPYPYPSKLAVSEAAILDQWAQCAGPRVKAGG